MSKKYIADSFVKNGGTAQQVLMADGSTIPIPSGGTKDFVASGTISQGRTVSIRTDGKVEQTAAVITNGTMQAEVLTGGTEVYYSAFGTSIYSGDQGDIISVPGTNTIIAVYSTSSTIARYRVGTQSVDKLTVAWEDSVLISSSVTSLYPVRACWDPGNSKLIILYGSQVRSYDVNGVTLTGGTASTLPNYNRPGQLVYEPAGGRIVHVHMVSPKIQASVMKVNGTSIDVAAAVSTNGPGLNGSPYGMTACYDESTGQIVAAHFLKEDVIYAGKLTINPDLSCSWTNAPAYTVVGLTDSNIVSSEPAYCFTLAYDPLRARVIMMGTLNPYGSIASRGVYVVPFRTSNLTYGSVTYFGHYTNYVGGDRIRAKWCSASQQMIVLAAQSINANVTQTFKITGSGTSFGYTSITTHAELPLVGNMAWGYSADTDSLFFFYNDTYTTIKVWPLTFTDTNILKVIGIANEAIADTATGGVAILGGINSNQSSLVPGTLYYVDYQGNIVTNPSLFFDYKEIGTAVSTTEILVKPKTVI